MRKVCLIIPSLTAGGAERVISLIANNFVQKGDVEVHLVLLTKAAVFYKLDSRIIIHEPSFYYKNYNRLIFNILIFNYLRGQLKGINPYSLLSFEGRYNSFVLLAATGLKIRTFISDRSRPGISYGKFLDFINSLIYRRATGIIAQTQLAKDFTYFKTKHKNIIVIGNPIPNLFDASVKKEKIILNVGRFIKSKQQDELIRIFKEIENEIDKDWQIWFLGEGKYLESCKKLAVDLELDKRIQFLGNKKHIAQYYKRASVFAFTSVSEGFPNALAEAMSAGCACISYNCKAGVDDIIDDLQNGFLITEGDKKQYSEKLELLIKSEILRYNFNKAAQKKMQKFELHNIGNQFKNALIQ